MKIINEPRYQDFNGKIYKTEKECINAENNFVGNVFQMFEQLAKGCKKYTGNCDDCPFYDNILEFCSIRVKVGKMPESWKLEEGE